MAQEDPKNRILFLILIGIISFSGGLLFLAVIIIILSALGLLTL